MVVGAGYGIDIDSQEPDWGIEGTGGDDFGVSSGAQSIFGGSFGDVKFAIVDETPTFPECEAQTALQIVVEVEQTVVGQKMCVLSSERRRAYVRIADIDTEADTISFDITVWKLPTDR